LTAAATAAAHAEFRASQIYADIAKALEEPTAYPVPVARQLGVTNNQVALVILDMERAELKTASANGDVKTITQAKKVHPNIRFAARKALQVTTARPQIRAQLNKIIKDRFRARKEYALVVKALTEKNRSRRFEIMSEYKVSSNFITRVARDLREQGKTINNRKPGPPKGTPSPKKGRRFSPGG
jgi:hypothetical protein